ncbi:MAG: hypothetical protein A2W93_06950 [Bacteroidetes bacterium GWF2_43_63]|nr:MAG: hypothetical protein A2W94_09930 [Bacteroidetes bacterium GWE2_42_42]OFY53752.1 MAG: hypothetical protein A2W93_06950 [Bacteroidetes bacterium GWF2_43_63]HCB61033.1 hypothetical protein [Bacteroidales bacterium]HCY24155.1 hypothetical protein [Bacteroidales bacterium]
MIQKPETNYKLVFAIVHSATYSWRLEAYAVQIMNNGMFAYNHIRVAASTVNHYTKEYNNAEYMVLTILDECRNESLARIIGHNRFRPIDFEKEVNRDNNLMRRVVKHLRNKTDMAISILADNQIPIYFKGDIQDIINEKPIIPLIDKMHVKFKFAFIGGEMHYSITTELSGKKVKLTDKNTLILNYDPCWLIMDNKFIQVSDNVDGKKIQPFLTKDEVVVEQSQVENYLKKFVKQIIALYPFELEGIEHKEYNKNPVPVLRIETTLQNEIMLMLRFRYDDVEFELDSNILSHVSLQKHRDRFSFDVIRRDRNFENAIVDWLKDNGLLPVHGSYFAPFQVQLDDENKSSSEKLYNIVNFVNDNSELLQEKGFDIAQLLNRKFFTGRIELQQQFTEDRDWFDLQIYVLFGDFRIPFSALRKNILENNRELVLPDGSIAILPEEWFSKFHDLALISKPVGENVRVKKSQYGFISNILEGNNRVEKFLETAGIGDFAIEDAPEGLKKELRPYQLRGMSWFMFLHKNNFGGCLSDDMGLGKTIQVLAFLLKMKKSSPVMVPKTQLDVFSTETVVHHTKTSLIIMPLSLVHNWENEIRTTAPELKSLNYTGLGRRFNPKQIEKYDLVLTTYGTVRNDFEKLSKYNFRFVFLDESQYIKNPESKIFAAVSKLNAEQRFVLTGTPVENSLIDLWSQLQFVNPGLLGDLKFFRDHFYQPIEKRGSKSSEKKFRQIINPFILRRTKNEVAKELPTLTEKIHFCPMTPEQQEVYEKRKSEVRNYIIESTKKYGADKAYMIILSGLMRMRLLANHPGITEKEYDGSSGKFDQVTESIKKVLSGGHKLLIFSQFVKHLTLYASWLEEEGIPFLMLTGQTNTMQRENMIKQFQKGYDYPIFLISLKAGGVGLNLTAADFVFLLDPWWNPAVEQQAINRTHRIGQNKKVISYKFITEGSIEEKIIALQEKKMDLFNNFINRRFSSNISSEDLVGLLE